MSSSQNKTYNGRILKEIEKLSEAYPDITNEITCDKITGNQVVYIYKKHDVFKLAIPQFYPFIAPTIFFNHRPYSEYIKLSSIRIIENARLLSGMSCFCCNSFLCSDRWTPGVSFHNIILEIQLFQKIKQMCYLKVLIDNIKTKYLVDDIDILSFLFEL